MLIILVAVLLFLSGCGASTPLAPTAAQPTPPPPPQVVIVSVDGLRADAIFRGSTLNIQSLANRGAYTWQAQTILPSNTLPSHVSMLSGYLPTVHKITWDDYLPAKGRITVATVFSVARAAGLRTTMVVGKNKFDHFKDTGAVEVYVCTLRGDDDVANQAIVQIQAGFDLMFVHFPDVDLSGHAQKWVSPGYLDRMATADQAIGRLLSTLPGYTTVILTADHGGHDYNHGTSSALDMTIPWIIAGPRTRHGVQLTGSVSTMDTAATAARILGLSLPADAAGKVVTEALAQN